VLQKFDVREVLRAHSEFPEFRPMPLPANQMSALISQHAVPLQLWSSQRCLDSENAVQEAFCRLAVQDPPPAKPVVWLYRVVRNLAEKQRLSSRRRRSREIQVAVRESTSINLDADLDAATAVTTIERLSDELREVLVARLWSQLTFEEIGELCDISIATASRRYRDAIEQLRQHLNIQCQDLSHE